MALSMLVMVSNKTRPAIIKKMERKSMNQDHISVVSYKKCLQQVKEFFTPFRDDHVGFIHS